MAPTVRTLDQIISEIGGVYQPQIQSLQNQVADIPNQVQAEEQGLAAKQTQAFGDILSGARRRGTGVAFGGIPLQEQAQYTASTYMPALANLRTAAKTQATSLQDAINQIQERRQNAALSLQQADQSRYDTWKSNQDTIAAQRANIGQYFGNNNTGTQNNNTPTATVSPETQQLYNQMFLKPNGAQWSDQDLVNDYNATYKSAMYGNTRDKQKLELYHSIRPGLFGSAMPTAVFANGGSVKF